MDVIAACREVGTYRGAAAMCGTTHKTVKRIIDAAGNGELVSVKRPRHRRRNHDVVGGFVKAKVAKTRGRITAKRLLPEARAAGYAGSASRTTRLVSAP